MAIVHRFLGFGVVAAFALIMLWGLGLRLAKREEAPVTFRGLVHYTENLLLIQVVIGVILFVFLGRRVVGDSLIWLHYLYGSLFPFIAVTAGRIAGLRRERYEYVGIAWGAFFAFGLASRALMTGLGIGS